MNFPTFSDILNARKRIAPYLRPTPLFRYPALDALLGTEVYVKHENYQPIGVFKVRGGINLVSQMSAQERGRGLITASTGNHGQSVTYAARLFGAKAQIVVPEGANASKVSAMQGMGAEVTFNGDDFDAARKYAATLAEQQGMRYVHAANEPALIAGVATYAVEILEEQPEMDVIIVPIGSGTGAAGTSLAAHTLNPRTRVIGAQSAESPAGYESWKAGELRQAANKSFSEGVATGSGYELPQAIMREYMADFVLVRDAEIRQAMVWAIECAHTLAESAGAIPLAAAYNLRGELVGKKVALVLSGGNTSLEHLRQALHH